MPFPRYDGRTEWYESFASGEGHVAARAFAIELLGGGPGRCLDLGTGTGRAVPALHDAGWTVVGVDVSRDQLEVARTAAGSLAQFVVADAHALPFNDDEFDAVVSFFTHTDFDEPQTVFVETQRVLRPGGRFVYLGPHPCFGSPFVARQAATEIEGAVALIRPGYRTTGWLPPSANPEGITAQVGINHQTLPDVLNSIIASGLRITRCYEVNDDDPPLFFALTATK
jgi:SAM-dependent methyltransferase